MSYSINNFFRHLAILTNGTTTVSDQSAANTDVIFAGTSSANEPTLQFIRPADFPAPPPAHPPHSVDSLIVVGNPFQGGGLDYGAVSLDYGSDLMVTNGMLVSDGELNFAQAPGSTLTLDGNSLIDNGGTVTDDGGGRQGGSGIDINGILTLGTHGTNTFEPGVTGVSGPGLIRELGKNDIVSVGAVGSSFHIDVRAGTFLANSSVTNFNGIIGPAAGSSAPTLGANATVNLGLDNGVGLSLYEAYVNTSDGIISLLNGDGKDVADIHFTGDPRGLNITAQQYGVTLTEKPLTASSIGLGFGTHVFTVGGF